MKSRSPQSHFFATTEDLRGGIDRIEAARQLQYVLCDLYRTNEPKVYWSLFAVESLGTSVTGDAARAPAYLVMAASGKVHLRAVPQRAGGVRYSLTQEGNPGSIVFRPSGLYRDECLVSGSVGTVWKDPVSVELYQGFAHELTRGFRRIRSYLVGPEALLLLEHGKRLVTMGVDEPPEYDLRL